MATFNSTAYKYEKKGFLSVFGGQPVPIHELLSFCDFAIITVVGDVKIKEPLPHTALEFQTVTAVLC